MASTVSGNTNVAEKKSANSTTQNLINSLSHKRGLDRILERPHITAIAFSGTVGVGLVIFSGELIGISGGVGCIIGYIGAGFVIIPVMRSLAEMVSVRPVSGALIDFPHTFVDEALGFAVGVAYWMAQCISMPILTAAAVKAADNFSEEDGLSRKNTIGVIVGFCLITLLSNLCGVKIYGELERVVMWLKMVMLLGVSLIMIAIRSGVGESLELQGNLSAGSNHTRRNSNGYANPLVPFLRFDGFNGPEDLEGGGDGTGISGSWGQFLAIWTSITLAMFSCIGGDYVIVTAGEARKPRKDLAKVARFMYLVPLGLYLFAAICVGMNIDFMNPGLYHPWAKPGEVGGPQRSTSPFIIVVKNANIPALPTILNAFFMVSAYTAGNTALFTSSRTLFSVAHYYGNDFMRNTLGTTNHGKTPVASILFCSGFSLLSFLALSNPTFNQSFLSLASFFSGSIFCVYASECIAYLRFKSGLTRLAPDIILRDSAEYRGKHYRAGWQPYFALFGLFASLTIVLFSGWVPIYLLSARNTLQTGNKLKEPRLLIADVIGAYSGPCIFILLFLGYKVIQKTSFRRFRDYQDKYDLPEFDEEPVPDKRGALVEFFSYFVVLGKKKETKNS